MAGKRDRLGKKQRLQRQERRRCEEAAKKLPPPQTRPQNIVASTFFPMPSFRAGASAYSGQTADETVAEQTGEDVKGRKVTVRIEKAKRKKQATKIARAEFEDTKRRVRLMELHINDVAEAYLKEKCTGQQAWDKIMEVGSKLNAALRLGTQVDAKAQSALSKVEALGSEMAAMRTGATTIDEKMEMMQESMNEIRGAVAELSRKVEALETAPRAANEMLVKEKADMEAMKAQIDTLKELFEKMQKTDGTKVEKGQGGWKGRLRSRGNK
ncbi:hypothetical protein COL26b_011417 [Colletotrichum chrysophilum]|uniref:uncharacterized protein n=1 Tax=Colletotrichum chrysophilum TaxID=1836956 RepID=UPI0022FFF521|nr:uncharacterized protein COL26b_011417 [Colletotrichum chrysophilum]KAJ0367063.1 hypothetical protein COL26b_011417 [Colletotrichum chrysophilum]